MNTIEFIESLAIEMIKIVGKDYVFTDAETLNIFSRDETEDLSFLPDIVVKPSNAEEISQILKYCNDNFIPVTARGAGTGLSGSALPIQKGISLSTERLNKIISIDEQNHQSTAEPGVITEVFQNAVMEKGLFYPVDPSSKGSCTLGGNLAPFIRRTESSKIWNH